MDMTSIEPPDTRVVLCGTDQACIRQWARLSRVPAIEVVSFVDPDLAAGRRSLLGVPVCGVGDLADVQHDRVFVASGRHAALRAQLRKAGVPDARIVVLDAAKSIRGQLRACGIWAGAKVKLSGAPVTRIGIFGASLGGLRAWEALARHPAVDISAFIDSDQARQRGSFLGLPVVPPGQLQVMEIDAVLIGSAHTADILAQLSGLGVPRQRIHTLATFQILLTAQEARLA
jgi:hypothetical protein